MTNPLSLVDVHNEWDPLEDPLVGNLRPVTEQQATDIEMKWLLARVRNQAVGSLLDTIVEKCVTDPRVCLRV